MKHRRDRLFLILIMASGFTVVPTIGSQGMGTLDEHFSRADQPLLDSTASSIESLPQLQTADQLVERQVLELING